MRQPPLAPSDLLLRSLEQTLEYAVIVLDPDGKITDWVGAAERVFGYSRDEILGSHVSRLFTAEDAAKGFDEQEMAVALATGHSLDDRWHVRKDGTAVWVTGTVEAIRVGGELAGFVKAGRDRSDLRTQLDSLANDAAAAHTQLERTNAFLRTLGHELRNPLSPLEMAAHIIRRSSDRAMVERAVETILAQTATIRRLADDLMEATRLHGEDVRLQLEVADLRTVVQEASEAFHALAAQKRLTLEVVQPAAQLPARIDKARLHQLLLNLLSNALKYTPEGGRIWLKTTQEAGEVVLRVEDTGIGVAPDVLPRIFDLFAREASAVSADPGGLGIGLAMVRQIAHLHGGSVQARSGGRGRGTEFTVRLPAA